jgi:hypothetical protein
VAITHIGHTWLLNYIRDSAVAGQALKGTAKKAVALTEEQHTRLTGFLRMRWSDQYECPKVLDIKPQHGYQSRVVRDGFLAEDYVEWLVAGCSDVAEVRAEPDGSRPYLIVPDVKDRWAKTFNLVIPITSDAHGYVHVFDVIPKGLPPRNKKTAP